MRLHLFYYALLVGFTLIGCNSHATVTTSINQTNKPLTQIAWRDTLIDLGTVKTGVSIPLVFYAKNVGSVPLIFEKIESTCGCTVVERVINKPVLPNTTDSIVAHFKMGSAQGYVHRKIYILANTQQQFYVLSIKANVVE